MIKYNSEKLELINSLNQSPNCLVVCSVYNHEKYLDETLSSILSQITDYSFRVLIHDDCSTDGSHNIIKEYVEDYPDKVIPVIEKYNRYKKREFVEKELFQYYNNYKYIAYCDGDDYWIDENKLDKQIRYLEEHAECSGVYCNVMPVNEYGEYDESLRGHYFIRPDEDFSPKDIRSFGVKSQISTLVMRNYYQVFDEKESDFFSQFHINHDAWIMVYLERIGTVHQLSDVVTAHRVVMDNGDSYTAQNNAYDEYEKIVNYTRIRLQLWKMVNCLFGEKHYIWNFIIYYDRYLKKKYNKSIYVENDIWFDQIGYPPLFAYFIYYIYSFTVMIRRITIKLIGK